MRIFHVFKVDHAVRIAEYFIRNRIVFYPSYTWPDKIKGPARFTFRLVRHVADNAVEMELLVRFLEKEGIIITKDDFDHANTKE